MQFEEIVLKTSSISKTRNFYRRTLELEMVEDGGERIAFQVGRTQLVFEEAKGTKPFYHFAFNVPVRRFSDAFEWVESKLEILPIEGSLPIAAYPRWNAQSFYFYDNNGSILECIVRFDLPDEPSGPLFSPADFLEISEIGIPSTDVETRVAEFQGMGIPLFPPGPRLPEFSPMGDNRGLLLVVEEGRPWIPTNHSSQPHPLHITGEGGFYFEM
jgi:catechol 2,3-dioxygenase-like lactoylglutathione lyase family enzyme